MLAGFRAFFAASILALSTLASVPAAAGTLQCAPFARGHEPRVGAVLAFSSSRSMPVGHVAMVSKVVGDREVLLTHANWSYRGGIERDVRAIDVSPNNDWTDVRVWYGPIGGLGTRSNPARGFIYAQAPETTDQPVQIASADTTGGAAVRSAF